MSEADGERLAALLRVFPPLLSQADEDALTRAIAAIRGEAAPPVGHYACDRCMVATTVDRTERVCRRCAPPVDLSALRAAVLEMREHRDTITSSRIGRLIRAADALFPRDATPAEPVAAFCAHGFRVGGSYCNECRGPAKPQEPAEPVRCGARLAALFEVCSICRQGHDDHHPRCPDAPEPKTSDEEGGR